MSDKQEPKDRKIEFVTALMLAVIIVAIAWCAYQSTLWNGVQTFKLRDVNSNSMKFVLKTLQQGQHSTVDAITFIQYFNALVRHEQTLSDFYYKSFRPDMKLAVDAWLKTDPLNNPNAPNNPFVMDEYNRTYVLEAQQFAKESDTNLDEAQQANKNSDNYVLMTVIYSSVLFVGAILEKLFTKQIRLILLLIALGITSIATTVVVFMPVTT